MCMHMRMIRNMIWELQYVWNQYSDEGQWYTKCYHTMSWINMHDCTSWCIIYNQMWYISCNVHYIMGMVIWWWNGFMIQHNVWCIIHNKWYCYCHFGVSYISCIVSLITCIIHSGCSIMSMCVIYKTFHCIYTTMYMYR